MSSTLLICFSCSHGAGEHSLPKSICHPNPYIKSPPPLVPSVEGLVGFDTTRPQWGTEHRCPFSLSSLCRWLFLTSSGFVGVYPGQPVGPLWLISSFKALWGDFGNDSHSPLQGTDAEGLTAQVKTGQQKASLLGVLHIPCLGTALTHCFSPTLCTAPSHPKFGGPLSFCLPQLHFWAALLGALFSRPLQERHLHSHVGDYHEQSPMARRLETGLTVTSAFQCRRSFGHLHGQPMLLRHQHPPLLDTRLVEETLVSGSLWSKMS